MAAPGSGIMSFRGTLNKFGFLFLMVMATAFYVWNEASVGNSIQGYLIGGGIGGLVIALILMFKQHRHTHCSKAWSWVASQPFTAMHSARWLRAS